MNDSLYALLTARWNYRDTEPLVFLNAAGSPFGNNQVAIKRLMTDLCGRARVKRFTIQAIRHHVASIILDSKKATMRQLQKFWGHQRQATTESYAHDLIAGLVEIGEILEQKDISGDI